MNVLQPLLTTCKYSVLLTSQYCWYSYPNQIEHCFVVLQLMLKNKHRRGWDNRKTYYQLVFCIRVDGHKHSIKMFWSHIPKITLGTRALAMNNWTSPLVKWWMCKDVLICVQIKVSIIVLSEWLRALFVKGLNYYWYSQAVKHEHWNTQQVYFVCCLYIYIRSYLSRLHYNHHNLILAA